MEKSKPIFDKWNIREVYLFGSYSRGEANKDSDVDSDDEVSPYFTEILLKEAVFNNCDFSACWITNHLNKNNAYTTSICKAKNYEKIIKNIRNYYQSSSCCNKLIKSEIAKKICKNYYNEKIQQISKWEDTIFYYSLFLNSKSACFTTAKLYKYYKNSINSNSKIENNAFNVNSTLYLNFVLSNIFETTKFSKYKNQINLFAFFDITNLLITTNFKNKKELINYYKGNIHSNFKNILKNLIVFQKEFSNTEKLLCFTYKYNLLILLPFLIRRAKRI